MPAPGKRPPSARGHAAEPRGPEKKIGPFAGGIGVAVWINTVETEDGARKMRSVTLSPRRYFDRETEEWRDSTSYRPGDLAALIFALQKAQEYIFTTPIPDEDDDPGRHGEPAY